MRYKFLGFRELGDAGIRRLPPDEEAPPRELGIGKKLRCTSLSMRIAVVAEAKMIKREMFILLCV
jgi:hypothetical protein